MRRTLVSVSGVADAHLPREGRRLRGEVPCGAARDAPRWLRPVRRADLLVGNDPPTTPPSFASTTSRRSSRRSTSSRRSSTTRTTSARSRRRTRSTTSSRWAASRSSRSRSPLSPRICRPRCWARSSPAPTRPCAPRARSSPAATRSATTSRSTASRSSARCIRTASGATAARRSGDVLLLTKALGTGLVAHAQREGRAPPDALDAAVASMTTLNREAADALRPLDAARRHRRDRLRPARARLRDGVAQRRPDRARRGRAAGAALGALELAEAGVRTGGDRRNRDSPAPRREHGRAAAGGARLRPADLRRPARLPAGRQGAVLAATFAAAELDLSRVGRVEEVPASRSPPTTLGTCASVSAGPGVTRSRRAASASSRQLDGRDVLRRHLRRLRPPDSARARLRPLAALRHGPFPTQGNEHAIIEFSNRMVALVAIALALPRGRRPARRRSASPGAPGALARPSGRSRRSRSAGSRCILDLHPLAVMSHFLLALVVARGSRSSSRSRRGASAAGARAPAAPRWLRVVALAGVAACAVLVVTGAVATPPGPIPGPRASAPRHRILDTVYIHVRATAVFGVGLLVAGWFFWSRTASTIGPAARPRAGSCSPVLAGADGTSARSSTGTRCRGGLSLLHVMLKATAIWGLTVAIVHALHRPPAPPCCS